MSDKIKEGCDEQGPEWQSGNIFIRPVVLRNAGDVVQGHKHHFDHTCIVLRGSVWVVATDNDGHRRAQMFAAPGKDAELASHFLVAKDWLHELTAHDDETLVWCVYSHRDAQGAVTQVFEGWGTAYAGRT